MEEYPQSYSYQIEASMESNNDSQTTQYPQSNSYQNESGMESKNSSSGILNKYLTSDDFKFQYKQ